ncbi:hypothetical protein [Acidaminococcus timonensis]|uniref:hypothetical protein n=1 Tax=Acidaminococcus timonensis TaxID=1871002 RepID=UPI003079F862
MKNRRFKQYWVRASFLTTALRNRWASERLHLPFLPAGIPLLEGSRGRQWRRAMEMMFRSTARGWELEVLQLIKDEWEKIKAEKGDANNG